MNNEKHLKRINNLKVKPVNDIIRDVQAEVRKNDIKLTFTSIKIYLMFFEYIKQPDVESMETPKDIRFYTSIQKLVAFCGYSPGMIADTIHKLKDAGVLKYVTDDYKFNPSVILLYKKFFMEEAEDVNAVSETDEVDDEDIYF